jgi:hypothetical protein
MWANKSKSAGITPFKFKASKGKQQVEGVLNYLSKPKGDKRIEIEIIKPVGQRYSLSEKGYKKHANKTMDRSFVRSAVRKIFKRFPDAQELGGFRATGAKAGIEHNFQSFRRPKKLLGFLGPIAAGLALRERRRGRQKRKES